MWLASKVLLLLSVHTRLAYVLLPVQLSFSMSLARKNPRLSIQTHFNETGAACTFLSTLIVARDRFFPFLSRSDRPSEILDERFLDESSRSLFCSEMESSD
ncbi:hypothetical protein BDR05DRAFT_694552 [Suillus weaverae]|nr:hypothetical protein BDR05DRAFT_694552 [Suillus weaverae]